MKKTVLSVLLASGLVSNVSHATARFEGGSQAQALQLLMSANDGLSVEERIYNLWVNAENSVPDLNDQDNLGTWVGLNVVNMGEARRWTLGGFNETYGTMDKYQKLVLELSRTPALKVGQIEIKPSVAYGYSNKTGNFDGNMDPNRSVFGLAGRTFEFYKLPYEGREDIESDPRVRGIFNHPVQYLASGIVIRDPVEDSNVVEYRQIAPNVLVGVRKIHTQTDTSSKDAKPCSDAKAITRKEKQMVDEERSFLGIKYTTKVEKEVDVLDHWELAKDYGVPGVCEVHYLMK